jgi:hypothetical protein
MIKSFTAKDSVKKMLILLLLIFSSKSILISAEKTKEIKILTIGNSFAWSVFKYLPKVAESVPGCKATIKSANIGGCSLDRHWNEVLKSEKDPTYKPYGKKYNLKELLEKDKWDIVTMQQVSTKSFRLDTYQPYFDNIYKYVRKYAPQAEIVIQMTWSYRQDHPAYKRTFKQYEVTNPDEMFNKLYAAYTNIAAKYNCRIIPSGIAIQLGRKNQGKSLKLPTQDISTLKYPEKLETAEGAFIRGRYWRKGKDGKYKVGNDRIHLNDRGQYLQACVWFATLFNKPTSQITFIPKTISQEEAKFLQATAQKAVNEIANKQSVK